MFSRSAADFCNAPFILSALMYRAGGTAICAIASVQTRKIMLPTVTFFLMVFIPDFSKNFGFLIT